MANCRWTSHPTIGRFGREVGRQVPRQSGRCDTGPRPAPDWGRNELRRSEVLAWNVDWSDLDRVRIERALDLCLTCSGQVGLDNPSPDEDQLPREAHDGLVTSRAAGLSSAIVAALIAAVLIGSQVLASAGPTTQPLKQPVLAATSSSPDAHNDDDGECTNDACGNAHSKAVHAWVKCKAVKAKDACVKPAPPGQALGHTKHSGASPGPASADGHRHGLGRALAPGQLKHKDKPKSDDDPTD